MFAYFFRITWRSLSKRGVFPIINILGLSIGLAVVLLISLLIFNEQSFDKAFVESKNIYRINSKLTAFMPGETFATTSNATGPAMQEAIPEVIASVRTYAGSHVVRINDNPIRIKLIWADKDFFQLFDTPFLHGTPEAVMLRPNAIAVSEEMAKTLFGNKNPMGETFSLDNQHLMEVAAVYKDYPKNSSFRDHKMIAPFMHSYHKSRYEQVYWSNIDYETFCLLNVNADTASVNTQMRKTLANATADAQGGWWYYPALQRLDEIHLHSAKYIGSSNLSSKSDIGKVKMLSLLSVIILLVACVNYMNLSTARAQKRSKEIGISKTIGATRKELIVRLMLETAIFTFVSFVVAFILAWALLPVFNGLLGEQLGFVLTLQPVFVGVALLIWIVTTLLAASYPVIYLSGFPPLMAIRSQSAARSSHANVRKVLSVGQFAVAIVLIAWVLIIQAQISFVNNKDLGYNPHNMIGLSLGALPGGSDIEALANDFRSESSVEMVARQSGYHFGGNGNMIRRDADDKIGFSLWTLAADPNFIDLTQMKLLAGRRLPEQTTDSISQIILNRAAVDYLGMTPEEVIGKRVLASIGGPNVEVCGVVDNFIYGSLHRAVEGFGIHNNNNRPKTTIMLRVKDSNMPEQLKRYEEIFKKHFPNEMFEPLFPEQDIAKYYESDRRTGDVAVVFSLLAIFVACMGVFGLTAFMAEQRTKEIGIRKVMGAKVWNVVNLFTNSYVKLLCIALVIAIPVSWWVGIQYLQNFAFRISLSWWIFVVAALITIVLTLLTVSVQAIKAAMKNPVEAIKIN